jgi:hypothetical protein
VENVSLQQGTGHRRQRGASPEPGRKFFAALAHRRGGRGIFGGGAKHRDHRDVPGEPHGFRFQWQAQRAGLEAAPRRNIAWLPHPV